MKKHIPTTLLQHTRHCSSYNDGTSTPTLSPSCNNDLPTQEKTPVELPDLINTLAQRNIDAMSPSRNQKKQNKAALRSVLHSIFSS